MPLTQTQVNILNTVKRSIDKAYAAHYARRKRTCIDRSDWKNADAAAIDSLLGNIGGYAKAPKAFAHLLSPLTNLVHGLAYWSYANPAFNTEIERDVLADLHAHAAEYELLAHMPPVRRTRKKREPKTLVGRRADAVDEKVREWERKLKLAKTKLAAYRKKQKYYTKKGEVVR
jgi:hypothetical protein